MVCVLITTSGTGSRLGNFTKYTNKSLIPVGDKYAICHIIDIYDIETEFVITLGYYGNVVKDFLTITYPNRKIQYVYVDKYEGEGSSLGYSMLCAKQYLQKPFIFHCCDTITDSYEYHNLSVNTLFVHKNDDYHSYSSINVKDNKVIQMNGKGIKQNDYIYTGLCYMKDYDVFWSKLDMLYKSDIYKNILSDIHGIQEMIRDKVEFNYIIVSSYFDTGNLISYNNTCKNMISNFNILKKDYESLCFVENRVIKFINDVTVNKKRIKRGKYLYPLTPRIIDERDNFMVMEFVKGELVSECKTYGEVKRLLEWAQTNLWIDSKQDEQYIQSCYRFYKDKTLERIKNIPFLNNEINVINGLSIGSIDNLLKEIDYDFISTNEFTKFHGDFILDNIMKTSENNYCLLDWRHEFDSDLYYGDRNYDLAKLRHNIIFNHSNINKELYDITYDDQTVHIDLKCNYMLIKQLEEYNEFVKKYNYNLVKIKIITAIIWLNMAPLYEGKLREFLFYFGKFNLYMALQEVRP